MTSKYTWSYRVFVSRLLLLALVSGPLVRADFLEGRWYEKRPQVHTRHRFVLRADDEQEYAFTASQRMFLLLRRAGSRHILARFSGMHSSPGESRVLQAFLELPSAQTLPTREQGGALRGTRRLAVILVALRDAEPVFSRRAALEQIFSLNVPSVARLFQDSSWGKFQIESASNDLAKGNIFGPFPVSFSTSDGCHFAWWASEALWLAMQSGFRSDHFDRVLYILPSTLRTHCPDVGFQPDNSGNVYLAAPVTDTLAHEVAHSFGLEHSGLDLNDDGWIEDPYGDESCTMGYTGFQTPRLFNAAQRYLGGWLQEGRELLSLDAPTTARTLEIVTLDQWQEPQEIPQVVRLIGQGGEELGLISLRTNQAPFGSMPTTFTNRVHLHKYSRPGKPTRLVGNLEVGQQLISKSGCSVVFNSMHNNRAILTVTCAKSPQK